MSSSPSGCVQGRPSSVSPPVRLFHPQKNTNWQNPEFWISSRLSAKALINEPYFQSSTSSAFVWNPLNFTSVGNISECSCSLNLN